MLSKSEHRAASCIHQAGQESPQLRHPLRAGTRNGELGHDIGPQHQTGNGRKQPRQGSELCIPGEGIRKAGLLRLEQLGGSDVHLIVDTLNEILRTLGRIEGELIEIRKLSERVTKLEAWQSWLRGGWAVLLLVWLLLSR